MARSVTTSTFRLSRVFQILLQGNDIEQRSAVFQFDEQIDVAVGRFFAPSR